MLKYCIGFPLQRLSFMSKLKMEIHHFDQCSFGCVCDNDNVTRKFEMRKHTLRIQPNTFSVTSNKDIYRMNDKKTHILPYTPTNTQFPTNVCLNNQPNTSPTHPHTYRTM